ncbi:hypothetical protein DY000_02058929 [Brassica cretica]|uniref:Uncharacterized protein n=1 Tax=Brassica cretica TaxID=69181 RepID=A0ABQ7AXM8_BRACR|nr:hypothetical protein DY000_02058929 [Brassica cretica]
MATKNQSMPADKGTGKQHRGVGKATLQSATRQTWKTFRDEAIREDYNTSIWEQRKPSAPRQDITPRNTSLVNQLRVDSRRRSLSFGTRTNGENLMWQEKIILSDEDHINTPFSTPLQNHVVTNTEVQLHENIMNELQDVTLQYVNVSDPVESETRRQRVLEGETHNLMAETAATMLAHALTNGNQNGSNHAFYATLEATENPGGQLAREDLVSEVERVSPEPTQPIQPRKRGRPPGKSGTTSKQPVLNGTGSKKHKVQAIQNSPGIRRSYSTQSIAEQQESKAGTVQNVEDEFDEEAVERDKFEIDQLVEDFVNEPSIRHDEVPESDTADSDNEGNEDEKFSKQKSTKYLRRGNGILYKD